MHLNNFIEVLGLATAGAIVSVPLLLLNIRFASHLGLIDWPKSRGLAEDQIPIVGASLVAITLAVMLCLVLLYGLSPWFLTTAAVIAVMGYVDDRKSLPALDKIFFQATCVLVIVFMDPKLHDALVSQYGNAGLGWGAFFILGLVNAVNFIDGIDGLAAIVITCGSIGYILLSSNFADHDSATVIGSVIIGIMGPFFYTNVRHRRGFLGNVGSYFFSYVLAVMHLSLPIVGSDALSRVSLSGLCFLIPIADAIMVVSARLLTFRSPFHADKGHLHHRLIQTSLSLRTCLLTFGCIELTSVGVAYFLAQNPGIRTSFLPAMVCLSHVAMTATLILLIERASRRRVQAYFQRLEAGSRVYFLRYEFTHLDGRPISIRTLRRLEARVSSEIRVTDLCISEGPNVLCITLKAMSEPLRGISARLEGLFQSEKVQAKVQVEQGEFVRVAKSSTDTRRIA